MYMLHKYSFDVFYNPVTTIVLCHWILSSLIAVCVIFVCYCLCLYVFPLFACSLSVYPTSSPVLCSYYWMYCIVSCQCVCVCVCTCVYSSRIVRLRKCVSVLIRIINEQYYHYLLLGCVIPLSLSDSIPVSVSLCLFFIA